MEVRNCVHKPGLQPLSLFPQILGNEDIYCLPYLSLSTCCPQFLKLHWLFAKTKQNRNQSNGWYQFYWCFLHFFSIRKDARNKLVSHRHKQIPYQGTLQSGNTPFYSHFICCHSPHVHHFDLLVFSNKTNFLCICFSSFMQNSSENTLLPGNILPIFLKCHLFCNTFIFSSTQNTSASINGFSPLGLSQHMQHTTHCTEVGHDLPTWEQVPFLTHVCLPKFFTLCLVQISKRYL